MSRLRQNAGGRRRQGRSESRGLWRRTREVVLAAATGRAAQADERQQQRQGFGVADGHGDLSGGLRRSARSGLAGDVLHGGVDAGI